MNMRTLLFIFLALFPYFLNGQTPITKEIKPIFLSRDTVQINGTVSSISSLDTLTRKIVLFKRQQEEEKLYNDGLTALSDKKYQEAVNSFTKVLKLNKDFIKAISGRATAYNELKQFSKALEDLDDITAKDSLNEAAYLSKANINFGLNKKDEAESNYSKVLKINPNNAKA